MKRSLTLSRERLAPLTTDELAGVNGAAEPTLPLKYCVLATGNSYAICSGGCTSRGTTCACAGGG